MAASAIITGYLTSATSQTTAHINEESAKQVAMLSESLTIVGTYDCSSQQQLLLCVDIMNNSGREIGIYYAYDDKGNPISFTVVNPSNSVVSKLPVGRSTITLTSNTIISNATLISENYVIYRI